MSIANQVREYFQSHPGVKINNAGLREALDIDEAQAISVALNVMFSNKEISRARGDAGGGFFYWSGNAPANARLVNGKDTADDEEVPPARSKPATPDEAVNQIERVLDKPKKKKSRNAGPKQSRVPRKAKADKPAKKRKYVRKAKPKVRKIKRVQRTSVADLPSLPAPVLDASKAVFAIRHDGELGIDRDGKAVSLSRAEVQALQAFLKTTSPLWSPAP